jgi:hypothetical protein
MKLKAFLIITAMLLASHPAATAAEKKDTTRTIPGWGTAIDPDGDCKIEPVGQAVKVTVPGKVHDLFPPNSLMNAPRVLQPLKGDFTLQVKIGADFDPGFTPAPGFNRAFHSGGVLIWQDALNYLRFERGELVWPNNRNHIYFAPSLQLRRAGTYIEEAGPPSRRRPVFTEPATWFKVRRTGTTLATWYSRDGKDWQLAREFEAFAGEEVQVGVYAVNTAAKEFTVTFDEFKVTKE